MFPFEEVNREPEEFSLEFLVDDEKEVDEGLDGSGRWILATEFMEDSGKALPT